LGEVLVKARLLGARELGHVLDAPPMQPQWQDSPDRRAELLESLGFVLQRETRCFEWRTKSGLPAVARRLDFRGLDEVGEEAVVGAIERVSEGTLDREIQDERDEFGPAEAARGSSSWSASWSTIRPGVGWPTRPTVGSSAW
jgi:hypothetical protein